MGCGVYRARWLAGCGGAVSGVLLLTGCAGMTAPKAREPLRATIEEYGIYTNLVFAGDAAENKWRVTGQEHVRTATEVPFGEGVAFGFRFRLEGEPEPDAIDFGVLVPPDEESPVQLFFHFTRTAEETRANPFVGYWLEPGGPMPCGTYGMGIWHDGRLLCEKKFEVLPPGREGAEGGQGP